MRTLKDIVRRVLNEGGVEVVDIIITRGELVVVYRREGVTYSYNLRITAGDLTESRIETISKNLLKNLIK